MATLPRTEHRVARSLAETPIRATRSSGPLRRSARASAGGWARRGSRRRATRRARVRGGMVRRRAWTTREFVSPRAASRSRPARGFRDGCGRSGEAAWIADVEERRQLPACARPRGGPACMPPSASRSAARAGVLGVVEFFTGEPRELDAELLATMATLGDQIGQAVERRRDAEALRARTRRATRDARRRARLRDHDGPRGPRRRFQPSRRAHLRLPRRARRSGATWRS